MSTCKAVVLRRLSNTGSISMCEAQADYQMSGGHLSKIISNLRKKGYIIRTEMRKHPEHNKKYARYHMEG